MRRKKLLRQVAAAAVALSMAVSLSAPAFAATFDLSNGGLVIKADDKGITVEQDDGTSSTYSIDEEIEIKGAYSSANGAMQTAEENQQEENQPVTPAKAPAKEETSEETQEAEDAPAAEKKQEQKDTEAPADPEQNTETENKDNNSDPADEEKKEQNAPANGELNASAGEGQESKAEDEGQPKPEAKASAEATASASDDASNGSRKAPARSSGEGERSGEKSERTGIIQIFNNTVNKIKLTLNNATIDQPNAANSNDRGMAAIDIQGSGDVEITVEGQNTLKGSGHGAGIQKNDDVSTGKLTITASDTSQTLNVIADHYGAAIGGSGWGWNRPFILQGTKNIEINGGTVNTQGRIGSGSGGGSAEDIVIKGNAVVNANGGIGGGKGEGYEVNEGRKTSITISGSAQVTADNGSDDRFEGSGADLAVIGGGLGGTAEITISGNAVVKAKAGNGKYIDSHGTGAVIGGGAGSSNGKKSHAKVTIEGNAQVTAENRAYGGGAGIGGGANGTGEVIIGGKAQVKATGSAEHYDQYHSYGAGAAIGDGGTTLYSNAGTVQNGENKFTTDKKSIQDDAKVEMTNIGHNGGSNTVTKTYKTDDWVTEGEQPPEKCSHSNTYAAEKVSPNCTEKGSQTYRCSSCGEITRVVELAPDSGVWSHDHQTVTVQPTCTEDGYKVTKCGRCGKELGSHYSIVKALGHQFVETTVDPTCTESGYTVSKCTRCHEEEGERTNLVAPLGHEYKNGVCTRCGAPEPQENGGSSSAAPNYTVTGAETYETSVVDGRYIIAVPSEDAALNAVLGDLRAIKAQGADVVVFRTRSRESSLVIDEMLAMGTDVTPFVLAHNGGEAQLTIDGAVHNELIH